MATNFELDSILSYSLNPSINRRLQLIAFKNACTKLFFFLNFLVKTRKKTFEILLRLKVLNENNTKKKVSFLFSTYFCNFTLYLILLSINQNKKTREIFCFAENSIFYLLDESSLEEFLFLCLS